MGNAPSSLRTIVMQCLGLAAGTANIVTPPPHPPPGYPAPPPRGALLLQGTLPLLLQGTLPLTTTIISIIFFMKRRSGNVDGAPREISRNLWCDHELIRRMRNARRHATDVYSDAQHCNRKRCNRIAQPMVQPMLQPIIPNLRRACCKTYAHQGGALLLVRGLWWKVLRLKAEIQS